MRNWVLCQLHRPETILALFSSDKPKSWVLQMVGSWSVGCLLPQENRGRISNHGLLEPDDYKNSLAHSVHICRGSALPSTTFGSKSWSSCRSWKGRFSTGAAGQGYSCRRKDVLWLVPRLYQRHPRHRVVLSEERCRSCNAKNGFSPLRWIINPICL